MGVKVRYVVTDPIPPSWWARNKTTIFAVAGLLGGFYLAGGCSHGNAASNPSPSPSPSVSRTAR